MHLIVVPYVVPSLGTAVNVKTTYFSASTVNGPIVPQLTKDSYAIRNIKHPEAKIGVIVGTKNSHVFNPVVYLGSLFLKDIKSHDGVVEMESNLITKATSLIMLHVNHVEMLWNTELFYQSLYFIKNGVFY